LSELRRCIWISSLAVFIVGVSVFLALYANNSLSASQGINALSDFPASDTATIGSYYLSRPPYFPNNSNKITKIFLESATLSYDYSNVSFTSDSGYDAHEGVPAVVINATIRNDYTVEEIIQFSQVGISDCVVGIDVYLYDNQGDFVGTIHRGDPFRGCYVWSLKSGEAVTVNMVFATPNRNIDYFEIYVSYLPMS
jgi:hypothetical protein